MLTKILDRVFSRQVGIPGEIFSYRSLPTWPRWLCGKLTKHEMTQAWSDRLADVGGKRCRCGKEEEENR